MAQYSELIIEFLAGANAGDAISFNTDGGSYNFNTYDTAPGSGTASGAADNFAAEVSGALSTYFTISKPTSTKVSIKAKYYGDRWNFSSTVAPTPRAVVDSNTANVTEVLDVTGIVLPNSCFGNTVGSVTISVIGGEWPFTYEWNVQGNPAIISTDKDIDNLAGGTYVVKVTDAAASTKSKSFVVSESESGVVVEPTITDISCNGADNGEIALDVSGGTAPYSYEWSHGPVTKDVSGLSPGNYSVDITDDLGCVKQVINLVVTEPEIISIVASIYGYSISLEVSGGTAPYSYAWDDGPETKDRLNLDPGDYSVTVTDDNGCSNQVDITISELRFFFSQNPVPLVLQASDPETKPNLSFINEVWIEEEYASGNYTKVATEEHPADSDAATVFRGESFLDAYLAPFIPDVSLDDIVMAVNLFKRFYYRHTEKFGEPPAEDDYTQIETNVVVRGGLSDLEHTAGNFNLYLSSIKPFMNWETATKTVLPSQPDYLFYLVNDSTINLIKVMIEVFYTDDSSDVIEKYIKDEIAGIYEIFCFPVGYEQLDLKNVDPAKTVEKYSVWIEDQENETVSQVRTYEIDYQYYRHVRFLMYQSAIGGMSTIALTGKSIKTVEVAQEIIDRHLPYNFSIEDLGDKISMSSGTPKISFSSGFITDEEYFQRLEDFIRSEAYYLLDLEGSQPRWIPVRVESDRTPLYDETRRDALNVLRGTIYLHTDRKYTPAL